MLYDPVDDVFYLKSVERTGLMKLIGERLDKKLRGGFYTPKSIVNFILKWGVDSPSYDILEPSCGDGGFIKQLRAYTFNSVIAIELDSIEAKKVDEIDVAKKTVLNVDFYRYCNTTQNRFDLIIGNPPYISFKNLNRDQKEEAIKIFKKMSVKYSKTMNAWVSFVVGSSFLLKSRGKIGFVLPSEMLQVSSLHQFRKFLTCFFDKINIISFQKNVFPGVQQDVVIFLAERNECNSDCQIEHLDLIDESELYDLDLRASRVKKGIERSKWNLYFLEQHEIDFLQTVSCDKSISQISDYAIVETGILTGSNNYFVVPLSVVEKYNLHDFAKPVVGKASQVDGIVFNKSDWSQNCLESMNSHLLVFPPHLSHECAKKYISMGVLKGIDKGYKTKIRSNWFTIPSISSSELFFLKLIHFYPKLILNEMGAYNTNTMHRVFLKNGIDARAFTLGFYNSLSFAFSEIFGRPYAGGVLELSPSGVDNILVPYNEWNQLLFDKVDAMIRANVDIDEVLKVTDYHLLKNLHGFTDDEVELANGIWKKMSKRRLQRKYRKAF